MRSCTWSAPTTADVAVLMEETLDAIAGTHWPDGKLVLLTADHGMEAISPERTAYVNVVWPELAQHLETGADGKPLAPAGSCRDLFLHVLPDRLDEVAARLWSGSRASPRCGRSRSCSTRDCSVRMSARR